jgi:uncharacterized protein YdcH (DUF465 family)
MGQTIVQAFTKLRETWIHLMHTCFAQSLLDDLEKQNKRYDSLFDRYTRLNNSQTAMVSEDVKFAVEIANLRQQVRGLQQQDPLAASIDAARHNAAQARIRDLEGQLIRNDIEPQ